MLRRSRLLNRILTREKLPPTSVHNPYLLRHLGIKHHCLLLNRQHVYNHIRHIKFNKFLHKPNSLFPLPPQWNRNTHRNKFIQDSELIDISDDIKSIDTTPLTTSTPVPRDISTHFNMISQNTPVVNTPIIDINVDDPTLNMSPGQRRRIRIRQERAASNKEKIRLYWENKAARERLLQDFRSRCKKFLSVHPFSLMSMFSASVGSHKKRNFNEEINEEFSLLDKLEVTLEPSTLYHAELASTLTYFQDEFHGA
ncbi:hypothetical protein C1645_835965 [Glomus cerebriforme]|uniref:Uncharacterized protein n=1 Tax=Glomus cerebriforme TaxID=658196 RepID=A0A397SBG6_9GLOM|nr:hypothetical protein C1645_835965 [Glomus cerebriforme]